MRHRPALRARFTVLAIGAALAALAAPAHASPWWDRLWRTPDQRGQALLDQGDAAAAARTFEDLRRRAYAALKAGDYQAAAHDLAAFDDRDAQYDRGNALARAGDLSGALKAYDAALARDPKDADARHNRDLVAQALAHQPKQPSPPSQGASKPASKNAGAGGAASGAASSPASAGSSAAGGAPPQPGSGSASSGALSPSSPSSPSSSPAQGAHASPPAKDDAAQARRDAQGMAGERTGEKTDEQAGDQAAAAAGASAPQAAQRQGSAAAQAQANRARPRSEQQMAEDEWLRAIPDDPGGLLRRKFLIEHLMRQHQP